LPAGQTIGACRVQDLSRRGRVGRAMHHTTLSLGGYGDGLDARGGPRQARRPSDLGGDRCLRHSSTAAAPRR
jgi:hypothetical protein